MIYLKFNFKQKIVELRVIKPVELKPVDPLFASKILKQVSETSKPLKTLSVISGLCVGATPPTSGFEVSDLDFRGQLLDLYKMFYTLFFR